MYRKKVARTMVMTALVQGFLLTFVNLVLFYKDTVLSGPVSKTALLASSLISTMVGAATFILLRSFFKLAEKEQDLTFYYFCWQDVEALINRIRVQRHDFINHLQVIHGFLQLDKHREAREYAQEIFQEVKASDHYLSGNNLLLGAFLGAKAGAAENLGIDFLIETQGDFKGFPLQAQEMVALLGNLLNNAMEAVAGIQGKKLVRVKLVEGPDGYFVEISNNGPHIPEDKLDKIFEAGFTTKEGEGHGGLGLATVRKLVKKRQGTVRVASSPKAGTTFSIIIPKG